MSEFISSRCHRNAICIFLTDFLDEEENDAAHLIHLKRKKYATYCIHLLSDNELNLADKDRAIYVDEELNDSLLSEPEAIREAYQKALNEWLVSLRTQCQHHGIPYLFSTTHRSPVETVRDLTGQPAV